MKLTALVDARTWILLVSILGTVFPAVGWAGETAQARERAAVVEDPSAPALVHRSVSDGDGGVIVVWQQGDDGGIRIQALGESGIRQSGTPAGISLSATGFEPSIAALPAGGALVAWEERTNGRPSIRVQQVDAGGAPRWSSGGILAGRSGSHPVILSDSSGGAWVGWRDGEAGTARVAHIDAYGTIEPSGADGLDLGAGVSVSAGLRLVAGGAPGVTVIWTDDAVPARIRVRHVAVGDETETPPAILSADSGRSMRLVDATSDGSGGVLTAWVAGGGDPRLRIQRLDPRGESLWSPGGIAVVDSQTVGGDPREWTEALAARVVSDGSGGAIVAWNDFRDPDHPGVVYLQRIDAAGRRHWAPHGLVVGGAAVDGDSAIDIVADGDGGVLVTFEEVATLRDDRMVDREIAAARFGPDGGQRWRRFVYSDSDRGRAYDQLRPRVVFDGSGLWPPEAIVVWHDVEHGDLYARALQITSPANDLCVNAEVVGSGDHAGTLVAGTLDGNTTCGGEVSDVWYRFVAPGDGTLLVDTCGTNDIGGVDSGVDTVLSLHSACPDTGGDYELTCNDDWPASADGLACDGIDVGGFPVDSYVELPVAADDEVLIRVSRFVDSFDGPFALRVRHRTPPGANDECRDAIVVPAGTHLGTLESATIDGEATCNDPPSPDVWYSYTATTTGPLHVNTCGSNDLPGEDAGVDTIVSVHSSCPTGGNPHQIPNACNDDWTIGNDPLVCEGTDLGADLDSGLTVQVTEGLSYVIRVSRYPDTLDGDFLLTLAPEGAGAGHVPDGGAIAGSPLSMERLPGGAMRLSWDASCLASDSDYAIYEGALGSFATYQSLACSTGGALSRDEPLPAGDHFYVVVPHNGSEEGSYGFARDAAGAALERPPAGGVCRPQAIAACP